MTAPLKHPAPSADCCILADTERQPCEAWTRVMGYHLPVASFNIGKKAEHAKRKFFLEAHTRPRR